MKKKIFISLVIIAVLIMIYFFIIKKIMIKTDATATPEEKANSNVTNYASPSLYKYASFPLKNGSKGKEVAAIQRWLNTGVLHTPYAINYPNLIIDGILGSKTTAALEAIGYPLPMTVEFYNTTVPITYKY